MKCCVSCFDDTYLVDQVIPNRSDEQGYCTFCNSEQQALVSPNALKELFELVAGIYIPADRGRTLLDWFNTDWRIFDFDVIDIDGSQKLMNAIFEDENLANKQYIRSNMCSTDMLEHWERIREELKYENRFFSKVRN